VGATTGYALCWLVVLVIPMLAVVQAIAASIGAVSGTVLSFELGFLWPRFMSFSGPIIGLAFSMEGFAFFTEAIFLGIYLYGRNRISPLKHWLSGLMVALSGIASGIFVVTANAWMNTPAGFEMRDGHPVNIHPIAAMLNPASLQQVIHMTLAAYVATALMVAGVHAFLLLRDRQSAFHRHAVGLALVRPVTASSATLMPVSPEPFWPPSTPSTSAGFQFVTVTV